MFLHDYTESCVIERKTPYDRKSPLILALISPLRQLVMFSIMKFLLQYTWCDLLKFSSLSVV